MNRLIHRSWGEGFVLCSEERKSLFARDARGSSEFCVYPRTSGNPLSAELEEDREGLDGRDAFGMSRTSQVMVPGPCAPHGRLGRIHQA
jgi:hypothetical protein